MSLHRSALRDITNTSSSLNASTLGGSNNGLKSILTKNGPRDSMKSTLSNTSSILSNTSILGGGGLNTSTTNSQQQQQQPNYNYLISVLVEFFSNENLGIDVSMKSFRDGDNAKARFYFKYLFAQLDMNLCVSIPTISELREKEKKANNNGSSNHSNNSTTTTSRNMTGLDEELILQLVDFFKIPVTLNKRHFHITPNSRNWQTIVQVLYHLVNIVKHSRNLTFCSDQEFKQELIFFTFLSNLYTPFLENDTTGTNTIINEWKSKFGNDSQRCKHEVDEIEKIYKNVKEQLQYFTTRKEPFIELEEKRILLENDFQILSNSISNYEQVISKLLNDLQLKKSEFTNLQLQSDNTKKENEMYQKQIEKQTITPLEVQNINREKSNLEEEESRLVKQITYTREQLEIVKHQLLSLNEKSTSLISQYNNNVLRIDHSLLINTAISSSASSTNQQYNPSSSSGNNNTFNRWRINDAKQKKSILKTQLNSLQVQIQQATELSIERDHAILDLEQVLQDQQELLFNLIESHSKLDDIYNQMKQQHNEELLQIEKRIKSTEEFSQRIHNEKVEYRHQLDQNEITIAQLEEVIAKEEAYFIQKRNACMNVRIETTHIVADHKQNFDSILTNCEKSQMDTFEYIKEIAQYTSNEMQKCINNASSTSSSVISNNSILSTTI